MMIILLSRRKELVTFFINQALDPNRKRGAFEKDMDNFLFGGGPSARGRSQKK